MFPINWDEPFRKKDGTMGTMEEAGGGGGSDLPQYDEGDAGKVLGVDDEGLLEWKELPGGVKIYYKDYNSVPWVTAIEIAKFVDGTASGAHYYIAATNEPGGNGYSVNINGYVPISATALDKSGGTHYGVMLGRSASAGYTISLAIGDRTVNTPSVGVRVFYVKTENVEEITS